MKAWGDRTSIISGFSFGEGCLTYIAKEKFYYLLTLTWRLKAKCLSEIFEKYKLKCSLSNYYIGMICYFKTIHQTL